MNFMREIDLPGKELLLTTLRPLLEREPERIFVSGIPRHFDRRLRRYSQPWFRLLFQLEGVYDPEIYRGEVRRVVLAAGDVVVVPSGGFLSPGVGEPGYRYCQVIFRHNLIRYLYCEDDVVWWRHTGTPPKPYVRHLVRAHDLLPLADSFDDLRRDLLRCCVHAAINELEEDCSAPLGKSYATFHMAQEYIAANFYESLDRETVARVCDITVSHLSRLFKRFAGVDFKTAVRRARLEQAEPLLRQSSFTIGEIAEMCGFRSATHFIRIFRLVYGTSPGAYAARYRAENFF